MEEKSIIHYDGSSQAVSSNLDSMPNEEFLLTDEIRSNISGNPFTYEINK